MAPRKTPQENQYVNWCFTVNNVTSEPVHRENFEVLVPEKCRYVCVAHEVGDTGTAHLQGYLQLAAKKRRSQVVAMLLDVLPETMDPDHPIHPHVEPCVGTPAQNIDYCQGFVEKKGNKENPTFVEFGTRPGDAGKREQDRFKRAAEAARAGRFDEVPEDILIRHPGGVRFVYSLQQHVLADLNEVAGTWLYGPPGCGKSFYARQLATEACSALAAKFPDAPRKHLPHYKACNKWFDAYPTGGDDVQVPVVIDDFGREHDCLAYYLKIWADVYPFGNDVKGGTTFMRPTHIIVTSNYHPRDIWGDEVTYRAIMRRFKVFHCTRLGQERLRMYEPLSGTMEYNEETEQPGTVHSVNLPMVIPPTPLSRSRSVTFSDTPTLKVTPPPKLARFDPPRMEKDPDEEEEDEIIVVRSFPTPAQPQDDDSESQTSVDTSASTAVVRPIGTDTSPPTSDDPSRLALEEKAGHLKENLAAAYEELKWAIARGNTSDLVLLNERYVHAAKELAVFEEENLHGK